LEHCDDLIEQQAIVTKQISSFTKDLKPLNTMDKKQSTIELLESSSGNESDCSSEDSINLDDIYDAPVVLDSSPNVKTRAPKAAISLDSITRKEKATKPKKNNRKVRSKK